jgi:hypothetical protein
MSRNAAMKDKPKGRGGKREGSGRNALGKVKVTMHVLPATRDSLGSKPGARVDLLVAESKAK